MTVTAHKLGGPVGVGALILAADTAPVPVLHGGGQERDIRSGTLDAPAIRAFAVAAVASAERRPVEAKRIAALRDDLIRQVLPRCPTRAERPAARPGPAAGQRALLLPRLRGRRAAAAARRPGIACSTGSACTAGVAEPSHVLLAMGADEPAPAARCASPWATPPPRPTSTPWAARSARAVTRARRAAARCPSPGARPPPLAKRRDTASPYAGL
jgi:cysteine desulfurase